MAEFTRSRLEKKNEDEITKKTIVLGIITVVVFVMMLVFGLPLLIRFSILLGDLKNQKSADIKDKVLPPLAPRIILPFEATNSSRIDIKGVAEKGVEVELLKNDVALDKTTTNDAGEFTFKNVLLDQGESIFATVAVSKDGGSSEQSKEVKVAYDDKVPELVMTNPSEDSLKVESADFDVSGKAEKGVNVTVNGHLAMVDDNGNFKLKLQLSSGKNEIEIVVKDLAGNETRKKITITYDI